jgi:hypothetical protein
MGIAAFQPLKLRKQTGYPNLISKRSEAKRRVDVEKLYIYIYIYIRICFGFITGFMSVRWNQEEELHCGMGTLYSFRRTMP